MLAWAKVFLALLLVDWVWARYMLAVGAHRQHLAGAYAAAIILLTIVSTSEWVKDPWLSIPAMLGAYAGTYISTKRAP